MAGLAEPTSGDVFLDGRKVEGPPRSVIYVFQQYTRSLFPWKTVNATSRSGWKTVNDRLGMRLRHARARSSRSSS